MPVHASAHARLDGGSFHHVPGDRAIAFPLTARLPYVIRRRPHARCPHVMTSLRMTLLTILLVGCAGRSSPRPGRYFRLMEARLPPAERRFETAEASAGLTHLEADRP